MSGLKMSVSGGEDPKDPAAKPGAWLSETLERGPDGKDFKLKSRRFSAHRLDSASGTAFDAEAFQGEEVSER